MKKLLFVSISMLFIVTNTIANNHYYQNRYVSISHLHKVFNQVKKVSDVSQKALSEAFNYYEKNRYRKHLSPHYIGIADYTKIALKKRLYIIDLHTGSVSTYLVAHGEKSGDKGGRVWRSSNSVGTHMTPYGFFKIGSKEGITFKKKYKYLSVQGLEWSNRNAGESLRNGGRDILLHTASYVNRAGRSYGCFAIPPQDKNQVFNKLKRALLYSYTGR